MRFQHTVFATETGTPRFALGIQTGTANQLPDASTDYFVGIMTNAASWVWNAGNQYIDIAGLCPASKEGVTLTFGSNFASNPQLKYTQIMALLVDISIQSTNLVAVRAFFPTVYTSAIPSTSNIRDLMMSETPAFGGHSWPAAQTVAATTANFWSNRSIATWYNQNIAGHWIQDNDLLVTVME